MNKITKGVGVVADSPKKELPFIKDKRAGGYKKCMLSLTSDLSEVPFVICTR
jgi:hypothetical protein